MSESNPSGQIGGMFDFGSIPLWHNRGNAGRNLRISLASPQAGIDNKKYILDIELSAFRLSNATRHVDAGTGVHRGAGVSGSGEPHHCRLLSQRALRRGCLGGIKTKRSVGPPALNTRSCTD